jgi:HAD superfamily hydrolase (TIGR01509 family)
VSPAERFSPDLVVFDCDGVLVDSERLTVGVEARVLTELGWPMEAADVVARWMGRTSATQLADIAERLGAEAATRFDDLTTAEVLAAFETELTAVPGVADLVDHLHATGTATCVASSGSHDRMAVTLRLTGLRERFDGRIFSGTEVEHGKPAPDLFLHAARSMNVDPARCAVVEDSVYGVRAAMAAGMRAYGFGGGLTEPGLLAAEGAVVFDRMIDLVEVFSHSSTSSA